ncbi:ATP-binding cassette domain-containing protein [Agrilactobacillus fermenti]|uniref:ABC transporter ATP-binding protein n=1 Tax=Agrilactobacillus fermenti TaxID=2586909 RepID=UPI003A5C2F3A
MTAILTTENLTYQVQDHLILDQINLSFAKGHYVTIQGQSGSGKSTILRLLANLISPTAGQIRFNQQLITELDPIQYRRQVSYCFQQPVLFGTTVEDNLRFPFIVRNEPYDQKRVVAALAAFNLSSDTLTQKKEALSGGERQRVALIRNVIFHPQILLLDEVTTGLDETNQQLILQWLQRLNQSYGITMIAVTHDATELAQAKTLVKIEHGQVTEVRTHA